MRLGWLVLAGFALTAAGPSCVSGDDAPPGLHGRGTDAVAVVGQGGSDTLFPAGTGGQCSDQGSCGTETHAIQFNAPNLYFVFDASGSMATPVTSEGGKARYTVVRNAAVKLVESLGPLINVGAAVFPAVGMDCAPGDEVMPVTPGDPFDLPGGPTTSTFRTATARSPLGGTPTAGTLQALRPKLAMLKGRTVVLILTDGGPNCNPSHPPCTADQCSPVIDGDCKPTDGCCDPGFPGGGPSLCVDRDATVAAIAAIHDLGIDVYTIGVADLLAYKQVMNDMAVAGGTALDGELKYVAAQDLSTLAAVFSKIAADNISCDIKLTKPPAMQGYTNVFLGCTVVPLDPVNGWSWTGSDTVTLNGDACVKLKSGNATQVKVITGCPTEMPK